MNKDVNRKLEDENLEANGSSDVVAFGYSEMNENMATRKATFVRTAQEAVAFGLEIEKVLTEIDDDDESFTTIRWKMIMPNEMASRIGWPRSSEEICQRLGLFEAIKLLPSLRGASIVIEGDFE